MLSQRDEEFVWVSPAGPLKAKVRVRGDGAQPVVLFIHGTASSGRIWLRLLSYMRAGTFIIPDVPGMGESLLPPGFQPSFDDWLDFLIALGAEASVSSCSGKCHLVGHSLGGAIAMHLAGQVWVDTISLVAPATRSYCLELTASGTLSSRPGTLALRSPFGRLVQSPLSITRVEAAILREDLQRGQPLMSRGMPWPRFARDERALLSGKRVLLIWGEDDRVVPPAHYGAMRDDLASNGIQVEAVALPECGHLPMLECPPAVAERLSAFWCWHS
jgi:pyruvate dehydrogenase E2 component (dihydrolipoamide acetyltransferase)